MNFKQFYIEDQEFTSKDTSMAQIAALHTYLMKSGIYRIDQTILDWGGGKYDIAKNKVEDSVDGINFQVYDPFNRSKEHNEKVLEEIKKEGGADIITIANVLNVIKEKEERIKTLQETKKYLKKNGKVYITVYNALKTEKYVETNEFVGQQTSNGWQNCQSISFYIPEVQQVFSNVNKKGSMIIAQN